MNFELLSNTLVNNYPQNLECKLENTFYAVVCEFNRFGTLLAVGCNNGYIVIYDFLTRNVAKTISAHVHPISGLQWSRNGYRLLAGSTDCTISIWGVSEGDCLLRLKFPSLVQKVQYNPRNENQLLIQLFTSSIVVIDIQEKYQIIKVNDDYNLVGTFDRRGKFIYVANSKGYIIVLEAKDLNVVASFHLQCGIRCTVKNIVFAKKGESFLIMTSDRTIRVYDAKNVLECGQERSPQPLLKLQDLVNRTTWKKCCFSGDGLYICGASGRYHSCHIWEKSTGNLVHILNGYTREYILDMTWHPTHPILVSLTAGYISIWQSEYGNNWIGLAPNFKELDENVEYEERESEFDLTDEDKEMPVDPGADQDESFIDVTSIERPAYCSSDEEDGTYDLKDYLFILPVTIDL